MLMRSKKAFKVSIHSETHQYQSQVNKIVLKSLSKNQNNLENITRNWTRILLNLKVPKHPT